MELYTAYIANNTGLKLEEILWTEFTIKRG